MSQGLGWAFLAVTAPDTVHMPTWLLYSRWLAVGVAATFLAGAWGMYRFSPVGWLVALLFVGVGAASIVSQVLAWFAPVDRFLFLFQTIALVALPYLIRRRGDFLGNRKAQVTPGVA